MKDLTPAFADFCRVQYLSNVCITSTSERSLRYPWGEFFGDSPESIKSLLFFCGIYSADFCPTQSVEALK